MGRTERRKDEKERWAAQDPHRMNTWFWCEETKEKEGKDKRGRMGRRKERREEVARKEWKLTIEGSHNIIPDPHGRILVCCLWWCGACCLLLLHFRHSWIQRQYFFFLSVRVPSTITRARSPRRSSAITRAASQAARSPRSPRSYALQAIGLCEVCGANGFVQILSEPRYLLKFLSFIRVTIRH